MKARHDLFPPILSEQRPAPRRPIAKPVEMFAPLLGRPSRRKRRRIVILDDLQPVTLDESDAVRLLVPFAWRHRAGPFTWLQRFGDDAAAGGVFVRHGVDLGRGLADISRLYDISGYRGGEMKYERLTVPALRVECKRRGLPCYQSKGRRLRKADLIAQLQNTGSSRNCPDAPLRPLRRPAVKAAPKASVAVQSRDAAACGSEIADPMAAMRAKAERDLIVDYQTAVKHAAALGISREELLEQDAVTMHRILRGCGRPADDRHWRTKDVIRGMVAVG